METEQKRTWREISLSNLEHNYRTLRAMLPAGCRFLGIVKANAYGNGAVRVARKLEELGCEYLAVACVDEAADLRGAGVTTPILILGSTPADYAGELLRLNLTQTVFDLDSAQALSEAAVRAGKKLKIHVKLDTGMSRLGFLCDEEHMDASVEAVARLCALPGLEHEGAFTHFSDSDGSEEYTMLQFTRFLEALKRLEEQGVAFPIRHCANSGAVLNYPSTHLDMVRPGLSLYGHYPDPSCEGLDGPGLLPVMELKSRVSAVRSLPAGTVVSYGRTFTLQRDSRLAVLPLGYADGLHRVCSNQMEVLIHGRRVPIVGRICMDMCMADVTDIPGVQADDIATVYGRDGSEDLPIEEAARAAGTIQYELLCAISERVPRVYLE
ncbi:MAG TPA: alanine racemase [Pseudoflavonifractor sp.]|nr:alanine racemase [Pseudoflavonifractor sp.]